MGGQRGKGDWGWGEEEADGRNGGRRAAPRRVGPAHAHAVDDGAARGVSAEQARDAVRHLHTFEVFVMYTRSHIMHVRDTESITAPPAAFPRRHGNPPRYLHTYDCSLSRHLHIIHPTGTESMTAPPMALPWPDRNLVVECTTRSAPCSIGLRRPGPARPGPGRRGRCVRGLAVCVGGCRAGGSQRGAVCWGVGGEGGAGGRSLGEGIAARAVCGFGGWEGVV